MSSDEDASRKQARGPSIRHLKPADARRVPWKNGRGFTEELALWPPGAGFERGDFDWRIARAVVDEAGPFSAFPGFDRVLVVAAGAGLRLEHGGRAPRARVTQLQPYRFSGDWPTSAALLDGPVEDVNVLTRRGSADADVTLLRPGPRSLHVRELAGSGHFFVHVLAGAIEARVTVMAPTSRERRTGAHRLAARESLWIGGIAEAQSGIAPLQLELGGSSEGVVLLASLTAGMPAQ